MNNKTIIILILVFLAICCCLSLITATAFGGMYYFQNNSGPSSSLNLFPTETNPIIEHVENTPDPLAPTPKVEVKPVAVGAMTTLETLKSSIVPENDLRLLRLNV